MADIPILDLRARKRTGGFALILAESGTAAYDPLPKSAVGVSNPSLPPSRSLSRKADCSPRAEMGLDPSLQKFHREITMFCNAIKRAFVLVLFAGCTAFPATANQPPAPANSSPPNTLGELEEQILEADSILFDRGFNRCKLKSFRRMVHEEIIMVHDKVGIDKGIEAFLEPIMANICHGGGLKPLRQLDGHSLEVFPLYENGELYGAIQSGTHSFLLEDESGVLRLTNRARFSHLWILDADGWKLKTIFSFDHLNPAENHEIASDLLLAGFDRNDDINFMLDELGVTSLSFARIEGGVLREVRTFGELEAGTPAPLNTIYNTASLAKPVTALVALKLADQGLLDLDAPLVSYDPHSELHEFALGQQVTARHVLTHTTGLANWRYLNEGGELAFLFEPGERFGYSGEAFEFLRQAIESHTSASIEDLAENLVFRPAGMSDTSYLYDASKSERTARPHGADGSLIDLSPHTSANGADDLMTTAADYGRFLSYVMDGGGLSEPMAAEMMTPAVQQKEGIHFGLGWSLMLGIDPAGLAIQHTGTDVGAQAIAVGLPLTGSGLVVLSNSENAMRTWSAIISEQFGETGRALIERNK